MNPHNSMSGFSSQLLERLIFSSIKILNKNTYHFYCKQNLLILVNNISLCKANSSLIFTTIQFSTIEKMKTKSQSIEKFSKSDVFLVRKIFTVTLGYFGLTMPVISVKPCHFERSSKVG